MKSELPPGWIRKREENPGPNSRWVSYIVRPEIRIVEDCNPEADVAKYKLERVANHTATGEDRIVEFIRAGRNDSGPTVRRWASFNCVVLEVDGVKLRDG